MKINGIPPPRVDTAPGVKRAAPPKENSPAARVAVSSRAKQLAEARAPEVADGAKVERLRASIASGEFTVDADAIADKMMSEER
jgi:flagellar biosynthesis anti-sigma factor FlgM